jgi:quercetin 2,3-dioxygenase
VVPPPPPPDSWASRPDSDVAIWTIKLEAGARWTVPPANPGTNRMLYLFRGANPKVAGRTIPPRSAIRLRADAAVALEAGEPVELLLLQGKPINEPVVQHGPFVMNSPAEIQRAFLDYRDTHFGGWPWPDDAPVHPREETRFAIHPDGKKERADR